MGGVARMIFLTNVDTRGSKIKAPSGCLHDANASNFSNVTFQPNALLTMNQLYLVWQAFQKLMLINAFVLQDEAAQLTLGTRLEEDSPEVHIWLCLHAPKTSKKRNS